MLIEGWLNKEGHGKKASKFSKRWVVVQENELRYYKSPTDEHPKGVQALALMRVHNRAPHAGGAKGVHQGVNKVPTPFGNGYTNFLREV